MWDKVGGCNRPLKVVLTPLKYRDSPINPLWILKWSIDLVKLTVKLNENFMRSSFQAKLYSKLQAKLEISSEQSWVRLQTKLGVSSEQNWTTPSPMKLEIIL